MHNNKQTESSGKQHFKRTIAFVCVACFIFISTSMTVFLVDHAAHEPVAICRQMLMPECNCVNPMPQLRPLLYTGSSEHAHADCSICAFIHSITFVRELPGIITGIAQADISMLASILCLILIIAGNYTPVDLKTRLNN